VSFNAGQIRVIDLATGARHRLTALPGISFDPDWSPGGHHIVFRNDEAYPDDSGDIWIMRADGGSQRNLTDSPGVRDWSPTWSPGGQLIAFASDRAGRGTQIHVMTSRGEVLSRLSQAEGEYPDWAPDGTMLAFSGPGDGDYDVLMMGADGSDPRPLRVTSERESYGISWSPDSGRLAVAVESGGDVEIHLFDRKGSGVQVTDMPGLSSWPVWLPDGRILFHSAEPDDPIGTGALFIVQSDGSGLSRVAHSDRVAPPFDWTPGTRPDPPLIAGMGPRNRPTCMLSHIRQWTSLAMDVHRIPTLRSLGGRLGPPGPSESWTSFSREEGAGASGHGSP
jgi:TolB protein